MILDGKALSEKILQQLKTDVAELKAQGVSPGLATLLVGENPASEVYIKHKIKACEKLGIYSQHQTLAQDISAEKLEKAIVKLNRDPNIHGILLQLPLAAHLKERAFLDLIAPEKDVDGFHAINNGKLFLGEPSLVPCTPKGIMKLLEAYEVNLAGKECVVVGRSNIVGKPMAMLLLAKHGTVTICHSRTHRLSEKTAQADVLIVAVGRARCVGADHVKPGAIVIDVGINRNPEGKLVGDVHYEAVKDKASMITPVPGGVGPLTIAMLMENTVEAARMKLAKKK